MTGSTSTAEYGLSGRSPAALKGQLIISCRTSPEPQSARTRTMTQNDEWQTI